jgi:hypothetical protein
MNVRHFCKWCVVGTLLALGANFGLNRGLCAQPVQTDAEAGVQVLTRGPVHEAFAETVLYDPEPGIMVPKAPPAAIEELPPDQKPEGANVAWIPGYWAWDDDRDDFLWVSGIWRVLPPGRQWMPGYWGKSARGIQWISGYWADARLSDVEYLPEPPATVEAGPNIPAPSADDIWLPGSWVWQNNRYAWRPGFWASVQPNWDWVPAHYVWAPRGYVYVDGYWDYSIGRRGVLFAPVYFDSGVYGRRGFSYSPSVAINLSVFADYLFMRPRYQHYYFGDYYAANYGSAGFYPSYAINSGRLGYDPIFAYDSWQHRQDSGWAQGVAANFLSRRNNEALRPPRTLAAQQEMGALAVQQAAGKSPMVAVPLDDLRTSKDSPLRFQSVDQTEKQKLAQHAQEVQKYREQRQKMEIEAGAPVVTPTKKIEPAKVKLPSSPIVAKPVDQLGKDLAPPKTYNAPKPDLTVEPKARAARAPDQPQSKGKSESQGKSAAGQPSGGQKQEQPKGKGKE